MRTEEVASVAVEESPWGLWVVRARFTDGSEHVSTHLNELEARFAVLDLMQDCV